MKIIEFLKYYSTKILKRFLTIIVAISTFGYLILRVSSFFLKSQYPQYYKIIEGILNWLNPWWIWIIVIVFWLVHMEIIYKLWKEGPGSQITAVQYDSVPEIYTSIVRKIEKLAPKRSVQVREDFAHGYRCLTKLANRDIKTAISIHFSAYKNIRDFLIKYFSSKDTNDVQITIKISQIRAKFEDNFLQLEEYNNEVGLNNILPVGEYEVRKLIDEINNNLNSLLSRF